LFMEQVSHHPPVSAWDLEAPGKWRYHGFGEATATVSGNSIRAGRVGRNVIDFADGGRVEWSLPMLSVGGLMWGARTMEYLGEMCFVDAKSGLQVVLRFDSESRAGGWFGGGQSMPTDLFRGAIRKFAAGSAVDLQNTLDRLNGFALSEEHGDVSGDLTSVVSEGDEVATFQGSWCEQLVVSDVESSQQAAEQAAAPRVLDSGRVLWDIHAHRGYDIVPTPEEETLPSDSRYRLDMQALRDGDLERACELKEQIEQAQRADERTRKVSVKPQQ
jgi:hypothetical protein